MNLGKDFAELDAELLVFSSSSWKAGGEPDIQYIKAVSEYENP